MPACCKAGLTGLAEQGANRPRRPHGLSGFSRITRHETRLFSKHGFFQTRNTAFPWLVWYLLVLKPFSLVFSAGICSRLTVMTPLLGPKTSSTPVGDAPAGDNKASQATSFQVFTRPETRDPALAGREAQAGGNSEVFTNHETRDPKHGFFRPETRLFRGSFGTCWY